MTEDNNYMSPEDRALEAGDSLRYEQLTRDDRELPVVYQNNSREIRAEPSLGPWVTDQFLAGKSYLDEGVARGGMLVESGDYNDQGVAKLTNAWYSEESMGGMDDPSRFNLMDETEFQNYAPELGWWDTFWNDSYFLADYGYAGGETGLLGTSGTYVDVDQALASGGQTWEEDGHSQLGPGMSVTNYMKGWLPYGSEGRLTANEMLDKTRDESFDAGKVFMEWAKANPVQAQTLEKKGMGLAHFANAKNPQLFRYAVNRELLIAYHENRLAAYDATFDSSLGYGATKFARGLTNYFVRHPDMIASVAIEAGAVAAGSMAGPAGAVGGAIIGGLVTGGKAMRLFKTVARSAGLRDEVAAGAKFIKSAGTLAYGTGKAVQTLGGRFGINSRLGAAKHLAGITPFRAPESAAKFVYQGLTGDAKLGKMERYWTTTAMIAEGAAYGYASLGANDAIAERQRLLGNEPRQVSMYETMGTVAAGALMAPMFFKAINGLTTRSARRRFTKAQQKQARLNSGADPKSVAGRLGWNPENTAVDNLMRNASALNEQLVMRITGGKGRASLRLLNPENLPEGMTPLEMNQILIRVAAGLDDGEALPDLEVFRILKAAQDEGSKVRGGMSEEQLTELVRLNTAMAEMVGADVDPKVGPAVQKFRARVATANSADDLKGHNVRKAWEAAKADPSEANFAALAEAIKDMGLPTGIVNIDPKLQRAAYQRIRAAAEKTRDEVTAQIAEAKRTGNMAEVEAMAKELGVEVDELAETIYRASLEFADSQVFITGGFSLDDIARQLNSLRREMGVTSFDPDEFPIFVLDDLDERSAAARADAPKAADDVDPDMAEAYNKAQADKAEAKARRQLLEELQVNQTRILEMSKEQLDEHIAMAESDIIDDLHESGADFEVISEFRARNDDADDIGDLEFMENSKDLSDHIDDDYYTRNGRDTPKSRENFNKKARQATNEAMTQERRQGALRHMLDGILAAEELGINAENNSLTLGQLHGLFAGFMPEGVQVNFRGREPITYHPQLNVAKVFAAAKSSDGKRFDRLKVKMMILKALNPDEVTSRDLASVQTEIAGLFKGLRGEAEVRTRPSAEVDEILSGLSDAEQKALRGSLNVDAKGLRTLVSEMEGDTPADATQILKDAVNRRNKAGRIKLKEEVDGQTHRRNSSQPYTVAEISEIHQRQMLLARFEKIATMSRDDLRAYITQKKWRSASSISSSVRDDLRFSRVPMPFRGDKLSDLDSFVEQVKQLYKTDNPGVALFVHDMFSANATDTGLTGDLAGRMAAGTESSIGFPNRGARPGSMLDGYQQMEALIFGRPARLTGEYQQPTLVQTSEGPMVSDELVADTDGTITIEGQPGTFQRVETGTDAASQAVNILDNSRRGEPIFAGGPAANLDEAFDGWMAGVTQQGFLDDSPELQGAVDFLKALKDDANPRGSKLRKVMKKVLTPSFYGQGPAGRKKTIKSVLRDAKIEHTAEDVNNLARLFDDRQGDLGLLAIADIRSEVLRRPRTASELLTKGQELTEQLAESGMNVPPGMGFVLAQVAELAALQGKGDDIAAVQQILKDMNLEMAKLSKATSPEEMARMINEGSTPVMKELTELHNNTVAKLSRESADELRKEAPVIAGMLEDGYYGETLRDNGLRMYYDMGQFNKQIGDAASADETKPNAFVARDDVQAGAVREELTDEEIELRALQSIAFDLAGDYAPAGHADETLGEFASTNPQLAPSGIAARQAEVDAERAQAAADVPAAELDAMFKDTAVDGKIVNYNEMPVAPRVEAEVTDDVLNGQAATRTDATEETILKRDLTRVAKRYGLDLSKPEDARVAYILRNEGQLEANRLFTESFGGNGRSIVQRRMAEVVGLGELGAQRTYQVQEVDPGGVVGRLQVKRGETTATAVMLRLLDKNPETNMQFFRSPAPREAGTVVEPGNVQFDAGAARRQQLPGHAHTIDATANDGAHLVASGRQLGGRRGAPVVAQPTRGSIRPVGRQSPDQLGRSSAFGNRTTPYVVQGGTGRLAPTASSQELLWHNTRNTAFGRAMRLSRLADGAKVTLRHDGSARFRPAAARSADDLAREADAMKKLYGVDVVEDSFVRTKRGNGRTVALTPDDGQRAMALVAARQLPDSLRGDIPAEAQAAAGTYFRMLKDGATRTEAQDRADFLFSNQWFKDNIDTLDAQFGETIKKAEVGPDDFNRARAQRLARDAYNEAWAAEKADIEAKAAELGEDPGPIAETTGIPEDRVGVIMSDPTRYADSDKFRTLSPYHAAADDNITKLVDAGVIEVGDARYIRQLLAQMQDLSFMGSLKFLVEEHPALTPGTAAIHAFSKAKGARLIFKDKPIIGIPDPTATELILHEIGHEFVRTQIKRGSEQWNQISALFKSQGGRRVLRQMIDVMWSDTKTANGWDKDVFLNHLGLKGRVAANMTDDQLEEAFVQWFAYTIIRKGTTNDVANAAYAKVRTKLKVTDRGILDALKGWAAEVSGFLRDVAVRLRILQEVAIEDMPAAQYLDEFIVERTKWIDAPEPVPTNKVGTTNAAAPTVDPRALAKTAALETEVDDLVRKLAIRGTLTEAQQHAVAELNFMKAQRQALEDADNHFEYDAAKARRDIEDEVRADFMDNPEGFNREVEARMEAYHTARDAHIMNVIGRVGQDEVSVVGSDEALRGMLGATPIIKYILAPFGLQNTVYNGDASVRLLSAMLGTSRLMTSDIRGGKGLPNLLASASAARQAVSPVQDALAGLAQVSPDESVYNSINKAIVELMATGDEGKWMEELARLSNGNEDILKAAQFARKSFENFMAQEAEFLGDNATVLARMMQLSPAVMENEAEFVEALGRYIVDRAKTGKVDRRIMHFVMDMRTRRATGFNESSVMLDGELYPNPLFGEGSSSIDDVLDEIDDMDLKDLKELYPELHDVYMRLLDGDNSPLSDNFRRELGDYTVAEYLAQEFMQHHRSRTRVLADDDAINRNLRELSDMAKFNKRGADVLTPEELFSTSDIPVLAAGREHLRSFFVNDLHHMSQEYSKMYGTSSRVQKSIDEMFNSTGITLLDVLDVVKKSLRVHDQSTSGENTAVNAAFSQFDRFIAKSLGLKLGSPDPTTEGLMKSSRFIRAITTVLAGGGYGISALFVEIPFAILGAASPSGRAFGRLDNFRRALTELRDGLSSKRFSKSAARGLASDVGQLQRAALDRIVADSTGSFAPSASGGREFSFFGRVKNMAGQAATGTPDSRVTSRAQALGGLMTELGGLNNITTAGRGIVAHNQRRELYELVSGGRLRQAKNMLDALGRNATKADIVRIAGESGMGRGNWSYLAQWIKFGILEGDRLDSLEQLFELAKKNGMDLARDSYEPVTLRHMLGDLFTEAQEEGGIMGDFNKAQTTKLRDALDAAEVAIDERVNKLIVEESGVDGTMTMNPAFHSWMGQLFFALKSYLLNFANKRMFDASGVPLQRYAMGIALVAALEIVRREVVGMLKDTEGWKEDRLDAWENDPVGTFVTSALTSLPLLGAMDFFGGPQAFAINSASRMLGDAMPGRTDGWTPRRPFGVSLGGATEGALSKVAGVATGKGMEDGTWGLDLSRFTGLPGLPPIYAAMNAMGLSRGALKKNDPRAARVARSLPKTDAGFRRVGVTPDPVQDEMNRIKPVEPTAPTAPEAETTRLGSRLRSGGDLFTNLPEYRESPDSLSD